MPGVHPGSPVAVWRLFYPGTGPPSRREDRVHRRDRVRLGIPPLYRARRTTTTALALLSDAPLLPAR
jgi:hypothetical protein